MINTNTRYCILARNETAVELLFRKRFEWLSFSFCKLDPILMSTFQTITHRSYEKKNITIFRRNIPTLIESASITCTIILLIIAFIDVRNVPDLDHSYNFLTAISIIIPFIQNSITILVGLYMCIKINRFQLMLRALCCVSLCLHMWHFDTY